MSVIPIKDHCEDFEKFNEYNDPVLEKNLPHYKLKICVIYIFGGLNSYLFALSYFLGKTNFFFLFLSLMSIPFLHLLREKNAEYQKNYNIIVPSKK